MKRTKWTILAAVAVLGANLGLPVFAQGESLDQLNQKESDVTRQSQKISGEIQTALDDVNKKYQEVAELKTKIAKNQETIKETKENMTVTEKNIQQRKDAMEQHLQDIQVNGTYKKSFTVLLDSENVSELVSRAHAVSVLQNAEKEKVVILNQEKEKYTELKADAEAAQKELEENKTALETQAQSLDTKLGDLKKQLADNQAALQKISKDKEVEKARVAAEEARKKREAEEKAARAAAEKAAKEAAEAAKIAAEEAAAKQNAANQAAAAKAAKEAEAAKQAAVNTQPTEVKPAEEAAEPVTEVTGRSGKTMTMESTAYSCAESVNTFFTAMGIDLRQNSHVIAVDPSVIPLGTMVEVEGYGIAIAGDTGGAIKGNIIDCHFMTVDECFAWGRRPVKVTLLS